MVVNARFISTTIEDHTYTYGLLFADLDGDGQYNLHCLLSSIPLCILFETLDGDGRRTCGIKFGGSRRMSCSSKTKCSNVYKWTKGNIRLNIDESF
jgi:hypothetical protein